MHHRLMCAVSIFAIAIAAIGCGGSAINLGPGARNAQAPVHHPWDDGAVKRSAGFTLTVWPDTTLGGAAVADYTLGVSESADEVVVEAGVKDARGLKAFYCDLRYDAERLTPVDVERGDALGNPGQCLELASLGERGRAYSGQVLVHWDQQAGFDGTAVLARLRFARAPMPLNRETSKAPLGSMSAPELAYNSGTAMMSWLYFNNGDYNQDGLASINDLTPLGQHLFEQNGVPPAAWPVTNALSQIDGNSDGALTINDVTNIGQWMDSSALGGWHLYTSQSQADYPAGNGDPNGPATTEIIALSLSNAINFGMEPTERLRFEHQLAQPLSGNWYWVRATDEQGNPGTPSNILQVPMFVGLDLEQVDYTLDGTAVADSAHGSARLTFTGTDAVEYFNLVYNGVWVLQNAPVITYAGVGTEQKVTFGFDLGVTDGTDVSSAVASASVDPQPVAAAPTGAVSVSVISRVVQLAQGRPVGLSAGTPANETGGEVVDFAAHASAMNNSECGLNECVPAAVSNSLTWLRQTTGFPSPSKPTDIATVKPAVGWTATGAPAGWADTKDQYMKDHGYGISTDQHPIPDDITHAAIAAECQAALDALKLGRDVELNGEGHCAAVVAMAKLADGRFVIYVSHDTWQGQVGGQRVEKVVYDPAAASPVAEGGWGFNGLKLNGFVVEYPTPTQYTVAQVDYTLEGVAVPDSQFGELSVYIEPDPDLRFINFVYNDVWVIKNIPVWVNLGSNGTYVQLMFPLGVDPGTDVTEATSGISLDDNPRISAPMAEAPTDVGESAVEMDHGRASALAANEPQVEEGAQVVDSVPIRDGFANQECGHNECVPAAASNSLTWMRGQYGQPAAGVDVSLGQMKSTLGYVYPDGTPAGWGGLKGQYLKDNATKIRTEGYPPGDDPTHIATADECASAFLALKAGADVELNGEGHCAVIVGAHQLGGGKYVFYVAHDTNQAKTQPPDNEPLDNGGTKIEKVIYDPAQATPVADGGWGFNGFKLNGFVAEFPPAVSPPATTVNLAQEDMVLQGVTTTDSKQGDLSVTFEPQAEPQYFNYMHNGTWVIQNLPVPVAGIITTDEQVSIPMSLGVTPGTPLTTNYYSNSLTPEQLTEAPPDVELGGISDGSYIMNSGEKSHVLIYDGGPADSLWVSLAPVADWAFLDPSIVVNQDCDPGECAPTAVSNSLKMLNNQAPGAITQAIDIFAMKGATHWTDTPSPGAPGIPVGGDFDDANAWWNYKKQWMLDHSYPVMTEKITDPANMGDITEAIRAGKDVELRVPGHVVMVVGAVELASGDMILWVAHDTEQGQAGGTVIEPVRYDAAQGILRGADWVDGYQFGNGRTLCVVESIGAPPPLTAFVYDWGYFMPGTGFDTDPYVIFGNAPHPFTITDPVDGDVTNSIDVHVSANPPMAGMWLNGSYLFTAGFEGLVTLTATYKGLPTHPSTLTFDVLVSMPADSIFAWPSHLQATDGEVVTTTIFCLWTNDLFYRLDGCRLTMEDANAFVVDTENAGVPGGTKNEIDGIWVDMSPSNLIMGANDTPVDLGGERIGYDFWVSHSAADYLTLATGALFNVGVEVHSDVNLSFQRVDAGSVDRTFYREPLLNPRYWANDDNAGAPPITLIP